MTKTKIIVLLLACLICAFAGFADAGNIPQLTKADKDLWSKCIKRVKMKPPCCGACRIMTMDEARMIWEYISADSPEKKTGKNLECWLVYKKKLMAEFKELDPRRFSELYSENDNKGGVNEIGKVNQ